LEKKQLTGDNLVKKTYRQGANLGQKQGIRKQPFETMTRRKPWVKTRRFTPGDKEKTLGKNKK
jgi:hypothetical protein